jgi:hypothetical protein
MAWVKKELKISLCSTSVWDRHHFGLQVRDSHRQLYCEENKFDLVMDMIADHPELCDPDRPRIEIR